MQGTLKCFSPSYSILFHYFKTILAFFLKIVFIHLGERDRAQAGGEREGEADSSLSWEPSVGLDPRTWRS